MVTWEACKFPERSPDASTMFVEGCAGCEIALRAAITVPPAPGRFDGWWRERDSIAEQLAGRE